MRLKSVCGLMFALAITAMTFVVAPKVVKADNPSCDSHATYDANDNGTEPDGTACTDPDPTGGIGD